MEAFLRLNGWKITASIGEQERLILDVDAGRVGRDELTDWLSAHVKQLPSSG